MKSAQAVPPVQLAASRCVEESDDEKAPFCSDPQKTGDEAVEPAARGGMVADADSRSAAGVVLTTVAQVRAVLEHAVKAGHEGVVVWGRCARCGQVGRVVHFDGALRARAQASW